MKVVFGNNRGGTGKTTLAIHFALYVSFTGRRVLCIDTDLNQLDLAKFMFKERPQNFGVGRIFKTDWEGIDYMFCPMEETPKIECKEYFCCVIDTHPNIFSPVIVKDGDILVIPLECAWSIQNAKDLIQEVRERAKNVIIIAVMNKAPRSAVVGTKEMKLARELKVYLFPYPLKFVPSMRRVMLDRKPIWDIDRRSTLGDALISLNETILAVIERGGI
jgi:cellulose biosynthesis protein BcsQ